MKFLQYSFWWWKVILLKTMSATYLKKMWERVVGVGGGGRWCRVVPAWTENRSFCQHFTPTPSNEQTENKVLGLANLILHNLKSLVHHGSLCCVQWTQTGTNVVIVGNNCCVCCVHNAKGTLIPSSRRIWWCLVGTWKWNKI